MNYAELRAKTEQYFRAYLAEGKRQRSAKGPYTDEEKESLEQSIKLREMPNKDYWGLLGKAIATDEFKRHCGAIGIPEQQEPEHLWMILDEIRKAQLGLYKAIREHGLSLDEYDFTAPQGAAETPSEGIGTQSTGATLSKAVDAFFVEHEKTSNWTPGTIEERQIADLLGQKTPAMARHYSRSANLAERNRETMNILEKENERRSQVVKPFQKNVKP